MAAAPATHDALTVKVAQVRQLTDSIKSFELVDPSGGELPPFTAGAHVNVLTGIGEWRSYSLSNSETERHRYVLGVLREKESRGGSLWMHENVDEGDTLTISVPRNNFPLAEDADTHLLIAGGIGITPVLSMARRLQADDADYTLHYCTRSPESTAFLDEIRDLCGERVVFHHDGGDPAKGIDLQKVLGEHRDGRHMYVCGPGGLIQASRDIASHWPEGTVHFELFSPSRSGQDVHVDQAPNEAFQVYLQKSDLEFTVPADKTLLEAIRDQGVEVDSFCEEGICSTCETAVISGDIEHRDEVLSDEEKKSNDRMMVCVSRSRDGSRLVLDL